MVPEPQACCWRTTVAARRRCSTTASRVEIYRRPITLPVALTSAPASRCGWRCRCQAVPTMACAIATEHRFEVSASTGTLAVQALAEAAEAAPAIRAPRSPCAGRRQRGRVERLASGDRSAASPAMSRNLLAVAGSVAVCSRSQGLLLAFTPCVLSLLPIDHRRAAWSWLAARATFRVVGQLLAGHGAGLHRDGHGRGADGRRPGRGAVERLVLGRSRCWWHCRCRCSASELQLPVAWQSGLSQVEAASGAPCAGVSPWAGSRR